MNISSKWVDNSKAGLVLAGATLGLGYNFFRFINRNSVNILFQDQWDFLTPLFDDHPKLAELFLRQHGPPREGLGLLADRILYQWTDWNVRSESFAIGGCIVLAMLLAFWLKIRLFGWLTYADAAIPLIFLTLGQYETLVGALNPAYSAIPLVLMMLYCLTLQQSYGWGRYAWLLLTNLLLIYTGFGLLMGPVTLCVLALECYGQLRRPAAGRMIQPFAAFLLAVASLGSFFIHYTPTSAVDCFGLIEETPTSYFHFVTLMLANFVGARHPLPVATVLGAAILAGTLAVLATEIRRLSRSPLGLNQSVVIAVLATYTLLYACLTAAARICLGLPEAAWASRYVSLLIPLFLALHFYMASLPSSRLLGIAKGIFLMLLIPGCLIPASSSRWFREVKQGWRDCYLRHEDISYCNQEMGVPIHPDPQRTHLQQKLDYLKQRRLNLFADQAGH